MYNNDVDEKTSLLGREGDDQQNYMQIRETKSPTDVTQDDDVRLSGDKLLVVVCILLCEFCERLTYYSVVANIVLYCTSTLKLPSTDASTVSLVFSGTVYLIPLIGGYVSDTVAGKFNTILGSGLLYVIGMVLLPVSAIDYEELFGDDDDGLSYSLSVEMRRVFFFCGLAFIALGTGGIKANVGPFGAQQVNDLGPKAVQSFFNWFYWFINAGASIAYLGVAYVQQNISFAVGFLVPLISMILALIIFAAVRSRYIHIPPSGSILQNSIGVCCATKCQSFDRAREKGYSEEMVDGVNSVLKMLPIFVFIILFWAIYAQMQSTFFLQGERMDVHIGSVLMPVAALNVFNNFIIMLTIPIMDRLVYPLLSKYGRNPTQLQRIGKYSNRDWNSCESRNKQDSEVRPGVQGESASPVCMQHPSQQFHDNFSNSMIVSIYISGFGFILAGLSVVVAGVVEIYRKEELSESGGMSQVLAGETFNASTLSVFLQVPQFALVGAGEVFSSISGYEFAYSQAPEFMQGVVMGMFLMTNGIGFYVSEAILNIVRAVTGTIPPESWYPDELNDGKAENLFFLLAGLMVVNVFIFIFIAKCYKYREIQVEVTYDDHEHTREKLSFEEKDKMTSSTRSADVVSPSSGHRETSKV
ncbi:hypothetical protein FSP39_020322 [Pinctada imbricata]|uniref:Solute carrier family 15 member 4 n=1 Tax=Pinctada imbricata TaxID=66713 RepID=A0AA88XW66_PINIB|nr:hypothetical protein FSP39_020322 [Pinctada imbricata]